MKRSSFVALLGMLLGLSALISTTMMIATITPAMIHRTFISFSPAV